ncbi:aspartate--tRNA(Asn) ligase [Candidatus Wolfebacteria bacterium]|nr:aspartate--tRNA(Asn) ligase [Candidatus Wolfebacteria bacterium]
MERILIGDLKDHIGKDVTIKGWVDGVRDHGKVAFLVLRDRSGNVQAVASGDYNETALPAAQELGEQYAVEIMGEVKERPEKMKREEVNGELEFGIKEIVVLSKAEQMPFDMSAELNIDTHLDNLPLTLRTEKSRAIFKVQSEILIAYRAFLNKEGFTEFQSPKITGDDAEGGANTFSFDYFGDTKAHLATSPQFYKQIMTGVYERVFSTGTAFRAEKHSTSRHLNEYTSLDLEMAFIKDYKDVANLVADLMRHIVEHLKETCVAEFKLLDAEFPLAPKEFPMMKLVEAQELIKKETGEDTVGEPDLEPEHERWLCTYAKENLDSDFIYITHYPVSKRPMYTFEDPETPGFTGSFDMLFRGVEIMSGGQRRHEYDNLVEGIKMKGLDPDKFSYYLQAFKYGMPAHGGIGMGLERLTAKFLNIKNVKEATLFPRDMNRIDTLLHKNDSE